MKDLIERQAAIEAIERKAFRHTYIDQIFDIINELPSAQPERVWTPCDIPPEHHGDVIVRGVETISGKGVYKIMQWDIDTWRPTNYAPSIILLDWSEI